MEKHHLIPQALHHRSKYAKVDVNKTIDVCVCCGDQLHQFFNEKELANEYDTLEKIMANDRIQKWVNWIQKRPNDFSVCMKSKKRR